MISATILSIIGVWFRSFFIETTCRGGSSEDRHVEYGVRLTRGNLILAKRYYLQLDPYLQDTWIFEPDRSPLPVDFNVNISFLASNGYDIHGDDFARRPVMHWHFAGFAYQTSWLLEYRAKIHHLPNTPSVVAHPTDSWVLVIPMWPIVILAALLEAEIIRRWLLRYWRKSNGLCPKCGFDLRATPDRCPECGAEQPLGATSPKPANS